MALAALTRLRLRSWRFVPLFLWHAARSASQAKRAEGCLAVRLRQENGVYWTMTLWRDREAMRAYMISGAHMKAMPKLLHWCDEASVAEWEQDEGDLPRWSEARRKLLALGRVSKVNNPSPAHLRGEVLGEAGRESAAG